MVEAWNLVRKYTHICSFRKYTFQCQDPLNSADASIFLPKISIFFCKDGTFTQSNSVKAVIDTFSSVFTSCKIFQVTFNKNVCFIDQASGIRLSDCSKLSINRKNYNDLTICRHDVIVSFLKFFVSLTKFSYWSKFHVDIIADAGVMKVFFYKGLTRNPEIGNSPSEFCPISGDWGKLGIPNLA